MFLTAKTALPQDPSFPNSFSNRPCLHLPCPDLLCRELLAVLRSTRRESKYNMLLQCKASNRNRPDPDPTHQEVKQDLNHLHPRWKIDSSGCCSGRRSTLGSVVGWWWRTRKRNEEGDVLIVRKERLVERGRGGGGFVGVWVEGLL